MKKDFDFIRPLWQLSQLRLTGPVAQLVEQCPFKALVLGSSPSLPTSLLFILRILKTP